MSELFFKELQRHHVTQPWQCKETASFTLVCGVTLQLFQPFIKLYSAQHNISNACEALQPLMEIYCVSADLFIL